MSWEGRNTWISHLTVIFKSNRYWRDCPSSPRRSQNQASNQSRGVSRQRYFQNCGGRGNGSLPWRRLDCCQKCPRLICSTLGNTADSVPGFQTTPQPNFVPLTSPQLFGGSAFTKEYFYKLTDYNSASWLQNFVASIAGASASLLVSAPLDVIKTRIQNRNFENPESGFKIVGSMMRNEGLSSFFKGLTPKLLMTGPKLVFSFWLAQTLIPAFDKVV